MDIICAVIWKSSRNISQESNANQKNQISRVIWMQLYNYRCMIRAWENSDDVRSQPGFCVLPKVKANRDTISYTCRFQISDSVVEIHVLVVLTLSFKFRSPKEILRQQNLYIYKRKQFKNTFISLLIECCLLQILGIWKRGWNMIFSWGSWLNGMQLDNLRGMVCIS